MAAMSDTVPSFSFSTVLLFIIHFCFIFYPFTRCSLHTLLTDIHGTVSRPIALPGEFPSHLCIPASLKIPEVQGLSSSPTGVVPCLGPWQPSQDLGNPLLLHVCLCELGAPKASGRLKTEGVVLLATGSETLLVWLDLDWTCFDCSDLTVPKNSLDTHPSLVLMLSPVCLSQNLQYSLPWLTTSFSLLLLGKGHAIDKDFCRISHEGHTHSSPVLQPTNLSEVSDYYFGYFSLEYLQTIAWFESNCSTHYLKCCDG